MKKAQKARQGVKKEKDQSNVKPAEAVQSKQVESTASLDQSHDTTDGQNAQNLSGPSLEGDRPPTPPPKDVSMPVTPSSAFRDSFIAGGGDHPLHNMRSRNLSRAGSIYSLSRVSFNSQILGLTSIKLPVASSLSALISSIPSSVKATRALRDSADQIQSWIRKATDVLDGLDAGDDVEWAAAAGRDGLVEVDQAISRFERLIQVYIQAVEDLQTRDDIATVSQEDMLRILEQVEMVTTDWKKTKSKLEAIKKQVEIAIDWEVLRNSGFDDIGMEIDALSRLVFEMEERRHIADSIGISQDTISDVDLGELESLVVSHATGPKQAPQITPVSKTPPSSSLSKAQDDTDLLALFARMQPLKALLEFFPMRISSFQQRAEAVFPTACSELQDKLQSQEQDWKKLEVDAESLRRELGEDRWVLVFRNAGKQALKMIDSVSRSIVRLDEALDSNTQLMHAPMTLEKIRTYEAKKMHYCPAIERVLAIVERGVKDRLTVNGEILRLQADVLNKWYAAGADIRNMDSTLEAYDYVKSQEFRDSVSSVLSSDRSFLGSVIETPGGSSPASSIHTLSRKGSYQEPGASYGDEKPQSRDGQPELSAIQVDKTIQRPSTPSSKSIPSTPVQQRSFSQPFGAPGSSQLPRKTPLTRSSAHETRAASYSPGQHLTTPPTSMSPRLRKPTSSPRDNRPRWNTSTRVATVPLGHYFKGTPGQALKPPTPKQTLARRSATSLGVPNSEATPSPFTRRRSGPFSSQLSDSPDYAGQTSESTTHATPRLAASFTYPTPSSTPSQASSVVRPESSHASHTSSRRVSMLPQPAYRLSSGPNSPAINHNRQRTVSEA